MAKVFVRTSNAPQPIGPYSQATKAGNFLFVAGLGAIDPKTGKVAGADIETQTRQTLQSIKAILEASGFSLRDVVKVSVFLKNAGDFNRMNEVYRTFFAEDPPARTTVVVASFVVPEFLVHMDAVAYRE